MPQDDVDEGCSGTKGPDEEADSDSAQVTFPGESNLADSRPTHWPLFKLIMHKMRLWYVGGVLVTRLGLIELLQC